VCREPPLTMNSGKRAWCHLLRQAVRLSGISLLIFATHLGTALGQDSSPDPSLHSEPEPASETESEDLEAPNAAEPGRRPLRSRLRRPVLTPEQLEEAERLRKLAAKFGTDPTAIVGRVQLSSAYYDLPNDLRAVDTMFRANIPFRGNYLLRVDVPFIKWIDPNRPGTTSTTGISDIAVTAGWRVYNKPEYAVLVGMISTLPTGTETGLTLGKYTIGPTIATARVLPDWDTFLIGLFTQQVSVGGDPSRKDVNLTKATLAVTTLWKDRWWSQVQTVLEVDWERKGTIGMSVELEVGRNLIGQWGLFARPGVGIFGQGVGATYDWNVEVGIRRTFKSF